MTERQALLKAIATAPADDLPRLVYADWLDENSGSDLDAATAEFIRVSCPGRSSPVMPHAAYAWLADHWRRLVPSVVAQDKRREGGQEDVPPLPGWRSGGTFLCSMWLPEPKRGFARYRINLRFRRGFCFSAEFWSQPVKRMVWPHLRADQPLVTCSTMWVDETP